MSSEATRRSSLVTPLPPGVLPFPVSEIANQEIDPKGLSPFRMRPVPRIVSAALAVMRHGATVEQMASDLGVSSRHLRSLFLEHVGLSPKRALRITRFRAVFDASRTCSVVRWAALAATYGYCDQSHLVDEFHALVGESPEAFRARCDREAVEAVPLLPSAPPWPALS
jgi:AraC-like DNA-binding protein